MLRNLVILVVCSILVWDFLTADAGQSAVSRATKIMIERVGQEVQAFQEGNGDLFSQAEPGEQPSTGLRSFFSVFSRPAVDQFISEAAAETGVAHSYLEHLAERESSFNPVAEAGTSSAAGLYQFVEQTWLDMFDRYGARYGQLELARQILVDARGKRTIKDSTTARQILNLRFDPKLSTFLAAQYPKENTNLLKRSLNRQVNYAELYMAHFLGAQGALKLIPCQ